MYHLKYQLGISPGQYTQADENPKEGVNIVDTLFIGALRFAQDHKSLEMSVHFDSFDGRQNCEPMADIDLWRMWVILGARLAKSKQLPEQVVGFLQDTVQFIAGDNQPVFVPNDQVPAMHEMMEHKKNKGTIQ